MDNNMLCLTLSGSNKFDGNVIKTKKVIRVEESGLLI